MTRTLSSLLAVVATIALAAPALAEPVDHREQVGALAAELIEGEFAHGLAIGLLHAGGREVYGFGRTGDAADSPVPDSTTSFEIGSVSKVFTGLLLADLAQEGVVAVGGPAAGLLPEGATMPGGDAITLEHLSTHASALPRMPTNWAPADPSDPFADYDEARLLAFLAAHSPAGPPGASYGYSNVGAGLLGHLLGRATGGGYGAALAERIFAPLGLDATRVGVPGARGAQPHDESGDPVPPWAFGALAGAGAISSDVDDLLDFVAAWLDPPDGRLGDAMRLAAQQRCAHDGVRMALGWHLGLGFADGDPLRWHNGQTAGSHSYVAFDPEAGIGVVVLANTASMMVDNLGMALVLMLRGVPYELTLPDVPAIAPETLERYVGVYRVTDDFELTVTRSDSRLFVQATGQPRFRVWPESQTRFRYRVVDAAIQFELTHDGEVRRLVLHQNGAEVPAPRAPPNPD
jgi:serine-type D-Ala-D-Ala carboxypeptidase/endopeptidase